MMRRAVRPETAFVLRFGLLAVAAAILWAALIPMWPALEAGTASMVAHLVRRTGVDAAAYGANLTVWTAHGLPYSFDITDGCTGLSLVLMYGVAVLAYPATPRQWLMGLLWGGFALLCVNTVRLSSLAWIGAHAPTYFATAHEIWWQGVGAIAVCLGWLLWLRLTVMRAATIALPRSRRAVVMAGMARGVLRWRIGVTLFVFLGTFSVLAVAGAAGGVLAYGRLVSPLRWLFSTVVFHVRSTLPGMSDAQITATFALAYALIAGGTALLCAVPAVPRRARVVGIVAVFVPLSIVVDAVSLGVFDSLGAAVGGEAQAGRASMSGAVLSILNSLYLALHLVLPLALWRVWARRAAEVATAAGGRRGRKRRPHSVRPRRGPSRGLWNRVRSEWRRW